MDPTAPELATTSQHPPAYTSNLLTTYTSTNSQNHDPNRYKRVSFAKRVTEEDLERVYCSVPLTDQGESQLIDVWRRYIAQRTAEEGAQGQFEAMEKMIQCYWNQQDGRGQQGEQCVMNNNRYYCEVWLKYAGKVRRPEDVYEMMLESGIGERFAKTYSKIADYYEHSVIDYRKADKVYRTGQSRLKTLQDKLIDQAKKLERETSTLDSLYVRFSERMLKRAEEEGKVELKKAHKEAINIRKGVELLKVVNKNEGVYCNKRKSYTRNQVILGGIPIFVDDQFRDKVIPQGTQRVEEFYDQLNEIDKYEPFSLKYLSETKDPKLLRLKDKAKKLQQTMVETTKENYFVELLKQKQVTVNQERVKKQISWLDRQPFLKLDYNQPLLLDDSYSQEKKSMPPPDTFAMVTPDPSPICPLPKQYQAASINTPDSLNFHLPDHSGGSSQMFLDEESSNSSSRGVMNVPISFTQRRSQHELNQNTQQSSRRIIVGTGNNKPPVNMSIIKEEDVQTSQDLSLSVSSTSVNGV